MLSPAYFVPSQNLEQVVHDRQHTQLYLRCQRLADLTSQAKNELLQAMNQALEASQN